MAEKRDTCTYDLKDGRRVVYKGTTDDLDRRAQEHERQGKNFTRAVKTSRVMTPDGAKAREKEQLAAYRRSHHGKNPRYNKDSDG